MIKHPFTIDDIPYDDKDGWSDVINRFNNEIIRSLYPILNNGLYHLTSKENCIKIISDGFIRPNNDPDKVNYHCAKTNYGFLNKWICLFDFNASPIDIVNTCDSWMHFFVDHKITIIFQLNRRNLHKLIDFSYHQSLDKQDQRFCIHNVESWYPEPINISNITNFIVVKCNRDPVNFTIFNHEDVQEFYYTHPEYTFPSHFEDFLELKIRDIL